MKIILISFELILLLIFTASLCCAQQTANKIKTNNTSTPSTSQKSYSPSSNSLSSLSSSSSTSGSTAIALDVASLIRNNINSVISKVNEYTSSYSKALESLVNKIARNDLFNSPIILSMVGISLLSMISLVSVYIFPEIQQITDKQGLKKIGRIGRSIGQIAMDMDKAINTYSAIEPEVCMMMALCTLGSAQQNNNIKRRSRTIDTINTVLNFPGLDEVILVRKDFRESHAYGRTGGNCELINMDRKCPLNYDTWKLLLSSLSSMV